MLLRNVSKTGRDEKNLSFEHFQECFVNGNRQPIPFSFQLGEPPRYESSKLRQIPNKFLGRSFLNEITFDFFERCEG